jgi:5-methylcytosine-specific restriction endonuclease McrA
MQRSWPKGQQPHPEYGKKALEFVRRWHLPGAIHEQNLQTYIPAMRKDPCPYCGRRKGGTIDHIIPRGAGGPNSWENKTGACLKCNQRKNTTPLLHFLIEEHKHVSSVSRI